uniref:CSON007349 protein n=1 Tax=Culicoides sonorensis TaxID=179676 RepID=A0A336KBR8_CULSO
MTRTAQKLIKNGRSISPIRTTNNKMELKKKIKVSVQFYPERRSNFIRKLLTGSNTALYFGYNLTKFEFECSN